LIVRQGQIRRIGWVIKTLEAQVGQFLLGCKCLVSRFFLDGLRNYQHTVYSVLLLEKYRHAPVYEIKVKQSRYRPGVAQRVPGS
jgi:hypothetical protein